jgi:hypothetical protein
MQDMLERAAEGTAVASNVMRLVETADREGPIAGSRRQRLSSTCPSSVAKLTPLGRQVLDLISDRIWCGCSMQTPTGGAIMSTFVMGCCRAYRRIARAFPHQYRAICGDGLEQLGEDLVPRVWQQQGVVGLIRLFGDLALRLPCEHFSTWADRLREATMADDVFEGTWRARQSEASLWKVDRPAPQQAFLRFEPTDTGYLMVAYGVVNGEACAERPQAIIADGRRRPLLDLSGRPIPGVPAGAMTFGSGGSQTLGSVQRWTVGARGGQCRCPLMEDAHVRTSSGPFGLSSRDGARLSRRIYNRSRA